MSPSGQSNLPGEPSTAPENDTLSQNSDRAAESLTSAEVYEQTHVHEVYNTIAPHFSRTRYKPWPIVERFLISRKPGSLGLDVGCGNGKNLGVNPDVFIVGSDRYVRHSF
jgi:tRNA (uracil-5-)-methyltransferase TRM9